MSAFKRLLRIVVAVAVGAVILYAIGFLISIFMSAHNTGMLFTCEQNMRRLGTAMLQYEEDYDERLPQSNRWASSITSRIPPGETNASVFHCPAATKTPYGYAMNRSMSSAGIAKMDFPADTVVLFESDSPIKNADGTINDVAWDRHFWCSNMVFADGHARNFVKPKPGQVLVESTPIWSLTTGKATTSRHGGRQ